MTPDLGGQVAELQPLAVPPGVLALLTGIRRIARDGEGDHDRGHAVPAG